jgi:hypothetical protein
MKEDKELKALYQFNGTEKYYKYFGVLITDGIVYIMNNGYNWFVSDTIITILSSERIQKYLKNENFLSIKLKVDLNNKTAKVTIEDGNNNVLDYMLYSYTDAKIEELVLFYCNGVLMLANEY